MSISKQGLAKGNGSGLERSDRNRVTEKQNRFGLGYANRKITAALLSVFIFLAGCMTPVSTVPGVAVPSRYSIIVGEGERNNFTSAGVAAVFAVMGPRSAEAAFPVIKLNTIFEKIMNAIQQWFTNLIQSFITSLTDINSLQDLLNLKNKLQGLVKNFNVGNLMNDILGIAMGEIGAMVTDTISGAISDSLGGVLKGSGLEEFGITGESIGRAIGGALISGNFKGAAQGLLKTFQGAIINKVGGMLSEQIGKIDLKGGFANAPSAQPGGGGSGVGTPYNAPDYYDESGGRSGGWANDARPGTSGGGKPSESIPKKPSVSKEPYYDESGGHSGGWANDARPGTGGGGAVDTSDMANPGMTKGEISEASQRAAGAANSAIQDFAQTYPMTLPSAQSQTAVMSVQNLSDSANRDLFAMQLAEQAKTPIIGKIVSLTGKYKAQGEGQKSAFDEMLEKYEQANQDLAKQAGESFSGGGDGDALRYIAGMMGTQVQQAALMNSVLIAMNRVLADEIALLEQIAYLGVEPYAASVSNQINAYGMAYSKMTNVVQ